NQLTYDASTESPKADDYKFLLHIHPPNSFIAISLAYSNKKIAHNKNKKPRLISGDLMAVSAVFHSIHNGYHCIFLHAIHCSLSNRLHRIHHRKSMLTSTYGNTYGHPSN